MTSDITRREDLTLQEWYAVSLCVGWVIGMSSEATEDGRGRLEFARIASEALRRTFGDGYHTLIREQIGAQAAPEGR